MKNKGLKSVQEQLKGGNSFVKYWRMSTGYNRGLIFFLVNEFHVMVGASFPGKTGCYLRRIGFSFLCRSIGKRVTIGRECSMRRPQYIVIGNDCVLGNRVALDVKHQGEGIVFGKGVTVGHSSIFSCPGGQINVGDHCTIGVSARLGSLQGLTLGKNVMIGDYSYIVGAGHAFESVDISIIHQEVVCKGPSVIGDNVVIGNRVTILDGVAIGFGATVLSDSVVIADVTEGATVSGVPAKPC